MNNHEYPKNEKFSNHFKFINQLSINIKIPKLITDLFRSEAEYNNRLSNSAKLDTLDDFITILKTRFTEIQKSLFDINNAIDRNNLKIDELEKAKNNKISFLSYSENFTSLEQTDNNVLKHSIPVTKESGVDGLIADEDSGIEFSEVIDNNKKYIKINVNGSKQHDISFISSGSVNIEYNETLKAYEVTQSNILQYTSIQPESEILVTHNLGTYGIDIKVFRIDENNSELKYPIMTGIEYLNEDQFKIYLTSPQLIAILIAII